MVLRKFFGFAGLFLATVLILACSGGGSSDSDGDGGDDNGYIDPEDGLDKTDKYLGLSNAILIEFGGAAPSIDNRYEDFVTIQLSGQNVTVTSSSAETKYNLIVSGTTTSGSLKTYGEHDMGIYLNGANIANPSGPAINIQNSKGKITVFLVSQTENYLADGANYALAEGEDAKGTFFSERRTVFEGPGSLDVKGKYNHAIAVDNDLGIENGRITISEAKNDGIHVNDVIAVNGGILDISSVGDAIQSEYGAIHISNGKITTKTTGVKAHGIISADSTTIGGNANVKLEILGNGSKGIKSNGLLWIKDGIIDIETKGAMYEDNSVSPPDTSSATGVKAGSDMRINGGELTVKSSGDKTKGMSIDKDFSMTGGTLKIQATDDGIKVHNDVLITGGSVAIVAQKKGIDCNGVKNVMIDVNIIDKDNRP